MICQKNCDYFLLTSRPYVKNIRNIINKEIPPKKKINFLVRREPLSGSVEEWSSPSIVINEPQINHFFLLTPYRALLSNTTRRDKMETTSVVAQSKFDHQQVAKNKRKKFSPKYMLTNSSSDNDEDLTNGDDHDEDGSDDEEVDQSSDVIPNASFSITKNQKIGSESRPATFESTMNPLLSSSKLSLLQTFNLQQQQHMFQQAAISAIAPQFSQQLSAPMNLSETEAKFREFAFKTMQELLNIYGLTLPPNEILDAMKSQQAGR